MSIFLPEQDEWTDVIRPILTRIRLGSNCLRTDAALLISRPRWETIAEHDMEEAQRELELALDRVRMARAVYRGKATMAEPEHLQAAE